MKIRLLKKIRKRYEINRIDELASNATEIERIAENENGLPFYELVDIKDYRWGYYSLHRTLQSAKDTLLEVVLEQYSEKFRHKDGKRTKVWHINGKISNKK